MILIMKMMMIMLIRFPAHDELGMCSSAVLLTICKFDEGLPELFLVNVCRPFTDTRS